jgi:NAD(P)H-flavin reductase
MDMKQTVDVKQTVDPMVPHWYRVTRRHKENADTFTLELAPADGSGLAGFAPGQFNMLYVPGVGEAPISISGNPEEPEQILHTTRAVGTVTKAMARLGKGDVIGVRGPFGNSWPVAAAAGYDVVIVAGGIGLAPLRPAIYQILDHREQYGKVVLLYGARTQEEILFRKEIAEWRSRFDVSVGVTVDRATGNWHGNVGVVTTLIPRAPFDPSETIAMVCGPEIMMRFTVKELRQRGITDDRIYLSMERNMKCAVGFCGHCQFGPKFICRDGPIFSFDQIRPFFGMREV